MQCVWLSLALHITFQLRFLMFAFFYSISFRSIPFHSVAQCSMFSLRLICITECRVCLFSFLFKCCSNSMVIFFSLASPVVSWCYISLLFLPAIINKFLHRFLFLSLEYSHSTKVQYVLQWNRIKYATLFIACVLSTTFHFKCPFWDCSLWNEISLNG